MRPFSALVAAVCMTLLIVFSAPTYAVDKTWTDGDPNNSFWDSDENWDPNEKPQPTDDAIVGGNPEVNTLEIFDELENSGTIDITTGTLQPQGDIDNTGTINIGDGSAINSKLVGGNSATISGSGEVVLRNSDNLPGSNATFSGGAGGNTFTNGTGHTIRGEGTLNLNWINNGTVSAGETSGDSSAVLRLVNATFVNNGELRSSSGASIAFISTTYSQGSGGKLFADTDNITLTGSSISGGSLESVSGGAFELTQGNNQLILSNVTINAPINNIHTTGNGVIRGNSGGITNNSTITLDGAAINSAAQFGFIESGTLDGTGEIVLVSGDSRTLIGVLPGTPFEFVHGANHTIRGAGAIGSPIINNGTIRAEPGTNSSTLTFSQPKTNNGLIEASSGTTIRFENVSATTQSASGVISAADGSTVELNANSTTGGRLETTGSGRFVLINTSTINNITNAGNFDIPTFKTLNVGGGSLTNDGIITVNSDGGVFFSILRFTDDTLLDGTGEVFLNGGNNNSQANIGPNGNTITQDTGHTVRGDGQIIGAGTFVNNGRIEGDSAADPLSIRTRLEGDGTLKDVSIDFDFSGTVHAPGNSVGTVPLEGSYALTHPNVRLEIEIGGLTAGTQHDLLDATGDPNSAISLGGTLDVLAVDLGNSYVPTAGDRFTIIESANPISGTFNSVDFPDALGGRFVTWQPVDYLTDPNAVSLEIASVNFFDADFDEDGDVDNVDLGLWEAAYASTAVGDANGDGLSNGLDFLIWQEQFGLGVPTPLVAVVSAVPEPEGIVSCFTLLALGLHIRGRRRFTA